MKALKERILIDGKNLGGGILKVDGFVNHQVDPILMDQAGAEFARHFKDVNATKILTAEISGIAPAVATGYYEKTKQEQSLTLSENSWGCNFLL